MRVIAGEFRSRKITSPPGLETRPTPDRLRESLFNILAPRIEGVTFVDAYAGCGSVGIEAISRGARKAIFIERSRTCVEIIRENLSALGALDRAQVIHGSAAIYLGNLDADIYFLDPPYDRTAEYARALEILGERKTPALAIVQHHAKMALLEEYPGLVRTRQVKQGDNMLSFFETR